MKIIIDERELYIDYELAARIYADGLPIVLWEQEVIKMCNKVLKCWILRRFGTSYWFALIINDPDDGWIMVPPPRGRRNPDWTWEFGMARRKRSASGAKGRAAYLT